MRIDSESTRDGFWRRIEGPRERRLCDSFGVSPSSYYAWRRYEPSKRALADARLTAKARAIFYEHNRRYGSPRVFKELKTRGERVSRKRIERLIRLPGIRGSFRRRFRRTTNSQHKHPVAPNLPERNFKVDAPSRVRDFLSRERSPLSKGQPRF